jgi:hypothetical protein
VSGVVWCCGGGVLVVVWPFGGQFLMTRAHTPTAIAALQDVGRGSMQRFQTVRSVVTNQNCHIALGQPQSRHLRMKDSLAAGWEVHTIRLPPPTSCGVSGQWFPQFACRVLRTKVSRYNVLPSLCLLSNEQSIRYVVESHQCEVLPYPSKYRLTPFVYLVLPLLLHPFAVGPLLHSTGKSTNTYPRYLEMGCGSA